MTEAEMQHARELGEMNARIKSLERRQDKSERNQDAILTQLNQYKGGKSTLVWLWGAIVGAASLIIYFFGGSRN